jgi:hypothetical protein
LPYGEPIQTLPADTAAVLVEVIQGRGGVQETSREWLTNLRSLCDAAGAHLIMDEVFTGFWRTGEVFAHRHHGVTPDIIACGKILGGGMPISACIGTGDAMSGWPVSTGESIHTSTFLGHPGGCAAASATLKALDAMDAAIWRFSQPVMFSAKSDVENTSNAATKLLYLFASDARLRTGIIIDAVHGIRSGKGSKAEHMKKIGVVIAAAMLAQTISNAYRDIFSDDSDEEIWTWQGYAKAAAIAPFAGYFLIGTAIDVALGHITGQKVYNSSSNPVVNAEQNIYAAAKHAPDAFQTDDQEKLIKELGRISKAVSVTPAMAVPGAIYNPIKTAISAKKNLDKGSD